jgi:hypothetical protein
MQPARRTCCRFFWWEKIIEEKKNCFVIFSNAYYMADGIFHDGGLRYTTHLKAKTPYKNYI